GLPEGGDGGEQLVTFTITAAPFTALETLAKANGVTLIHQEGIWYLRPANDQELIGRIYEINYNAQELVTKNTQQGVSTGSTGGGSGSGASGLNLQGSPDFFVTEPSRILEDIQNILSITTTGGTVAIAPTASVDNLAQLSLSGFAPTPDVVARAIQGGQDNAALAGAQPGAGGDSEAKVIWNSDSNTLYVVATRQQHQWIEAYLASADRPQPMIAIEVKFLETSRDPSSDLGIDWDGVLGETGLEATLSDATGPLDLSNVGSYALPTAVLSYSDLNWKLRAIFNDRRTRSVSYPRMVTLDNREVSFRSVINQPVLGSSASTSLGAGATQTSAVEYLPIGTVINILPKRMAGDKILLNVSVTVSDIIGTEFINGNPFPIATSRVYTAPLTVKSGYTVAISGLDATRSEDQQRGVPGLAKIPILGGAFKRRQQDRSRQHLMMLITPMAINSGNGGLTEKPVIQEPWKTAAMAEAYPKAPIHHPPAPKPHRPLRAEPLGEMEPIDDIPDFHESAEAKKREQTFGRKPSEATVTARTLAASVEEAPQPTERIEAPAADLAETDEVGMGPRISDPPVDLGPAPSSSSTATTSLRELAAQPKPGPRPIQPITISDGDEQGAKVSKLIAEVGRLKRQLSDIPEGEDQLAQAYADTIVDVYQSTQELLAQVEEVRGDKNVPLQGDLGDVWWDLIQLKTQAVKLSRRTDENLAVTIEP
ncbi:MAG: hypothetical protein AAF236_16860, partial [Verrucomicrobiota bacterium]